MRRPVLSQNYPNYSPPMPPALDKGNSNSVIKQNIASLKVTNPEIYEKYKSDPKTLVHMANSFLKVAKDPEMTALEELEAPSSSFKTSNFRDNVAGGIKTYIQRGKDDEEFGEDYALDQRAKSLASISRAEKDPFTTLFDDGNKVPSAYTEPVLYNNPEENDFGQLDNVEEPPLLADFTSPMPTGARLDPYMDIPNVKQDDPIDDMVAGENLYQYTSTPDGHHRMPNGSIMPDSEMNPATSFNEERYNVNTNQGGGVLETNGDLPAKGNGILNTDTTSSNDRKGSAVSANARGSAMPFGKINRNEALMRIGGAIVGGSSQGFSGAMKAATDEFGNIQDANRQAETDAFNKAEATRLAEERIAALKAKADAKNAKTVDPESLRYGQAALASINSIQSSLDNDTSENIFDSMNIFDNATGVFGNLLKSVPNTPAHSVMLNIETIEAAVAFDRLQAMRNASKTGGALGQVSNIELRLLSSSLGNLKQSNSKEEFQRNLNQVKKVYNEIVHGKDYQDPSDVKKPTTNNDALYNEADAIIG